MGLPASGKSTAAKEILKQGNWLRVNRDLIREMYHNNVWSGKKEDMTVGLEKTAASLALAKGYSVVVDDTNLTKSNKDMWKNVAKIMEASFQTKNIDTDYKTCIERDSLRPNPVGEQVIKEFAFSSRRYPQERPFIICDIDGTIADIAHRLEYVKGDTKDWKSFFANIDNDSPRQDIIDEVFQLANLKQQEVIFVTGRPDTYRKETEAWLEKYTPDYSMLLMRRCDDKRPDNEVKQGIYDKFLKHYEIDMIYDDRPRVIRMWRENKLTVKDVGPGIEF